MMRRTSCIDGRAVANAYPPVTTGPRLLKILIARRDEYRDRDSDLLLAACHSKAQLFGTQDGWVSRDKKTLPHAQCHKPSQSKAHLFGNQIGCWVHILGCQRQAKPAHWTHVFRVLSLDDFICLGENTLFWTLGPAHLGLDKPMCRLKDDAIGFC